MSHKAGFITILGNPNVGKSTLMNAFLGESLSITNPKAQTTRHRIIGILNTEEYQIVFSDTPGIIKPAYRLQEGMMKFVSSALEDADAFLYVTEPKDAPLKSVDIEEKLKKTDVPLVIVINKIDTIDQESLERGVAAYKEQFPKALIIPISALHKANIDQLLKIIVGYLPEHPAYYPKDELTDRSERFFVSEMIRNHILALYQKEIPYSCEVIVDSFSESEKLIKIRAEIIVARDTQKGIIIGDKGSKLKSLGIRSRKDIETFLGKQVFLELHVKVNKNWRESDTQLKRFGYL